MASCSMNSEAADTLVIGYGNPLRSDDAAGLHVARAVDGPQFRVIETYQLTPELAEDISTYRRVIFVDCDVELAPGEVRVSTVEPTVHADTHLQTPGDLLRLARDLYGASPLALLVGIGPATMELGETLSPAVAEAVGLAADLIHSGTLPLHTSS